MPDQPAAPELNESFVIDEKYCGKGQEADGDGEADALGGLLVDAVLVAVYETEGDGVGDTDLVADPVAEDENVLDIELESVIDTVVVTDADAVAVTVDVSEAVSETVRVSVTDTVTEFETDDDELGDTVSEALGESVTVAEADAS